LKEKFPGTLTDGFWVQVSADERKEATDAVPDGSAAAASAIHKISEAGQLLTGLALLRQKGFDIGSIVSSAGGPGHFRVNDVDDVKGVSLQGLGDVKAETPVVAVSAFLSDWSHARVADVVEHFAGWKEHRVFSAASAKLLGCKASVLKGLISCSSLVQSSHPVVGKIDIFLKPVRKVVSTVDAPSGSIMLSPDTLSIKVEDKASSDITCGYNADGVLEVRVIDVIGEREFDPFPLNAFVLSSAVSPTAMSPFWFVTSSSDQEAVNMKFGWHTVQSLEGTDWAGDVELSGPAKKRLRKGDVAGEAVLERRVLVPCLVNSKAISVGDELVCYRPAAAPRPKKATAISVTQLTRSK